MVIFISIFILLVRYQIVTNVLGKIFVSCVISGLFSSITVVNALTTLTICLEAVYRARFLIVPVAVQATYATVVKQDLFCKEIRVYVHQQWTLAKQRAYVSVVRYKIVINAISMMCVRCFWAFLKIQALI